MVPFFVSESAYCRGIVSNINTVAAQLRRRSGVVAWVVPGYREPTARDRDLLGPVVAELYARSGGVGEPTDQIWPGLAVKHDDVVVERTAHSAFFPGRCPLPDRLEDRGIDTVIMTGTQTNVCVGASVRDASTWGYRVILVADGCAAMRDHDHHASLHVVYRSFGDVRSTSGVVQLINSGAGAGPTPRTLSLCGVWGGGAHRARDRGHLQSPGDWNCPQPPCLRHLFRKPSSSQLPRPSEALEGAAAEALSRPRRHRTRMQR